MAIVSAKGSAAQTRNYALNGCFDINQRGFTSITQSSGGTYGFDRWHKNFNRGTVTWTPQTFALGELQTNYVELKNYSQVAVSGQTETDSLAILGTDIEDVRTLAGQTVTLSFYAKAATGSPKISVELNQQWGTGGTPTASEVNNNLGTVTLTNSWARYSVTGTLASIAGKIIGTNNDSFLRIYMWLSAGSSFNSRANSIGVQNNTFSIAGVQLEPGTVATPLMRTNPTIQGELAACQRYYYRMSGNAYNVFTEFSGAFNSTTLYVPINLKTTMRAAPTAIDYSTGLKCTDLVNYTDITLLIIDVANPERCVLRASVSSGLTQYRPTAIGSGGSTFQYLGISAEYF